jgi:diketogulonate reductase-like aldo/keto reductase
MEELVAAGKTKSIGVSNFNIGQLQDVLDNCKIKPVCNQFEIHPILPNNEWVNFCLKNGVVPVAYAPLGANDRSWAQKGEPILLEQPGILEIAKKHNKTPAQIVLKWNIQRGNVVIPKSVTPSRIEENSQV